jgi:hypothetical protein
VDYRFFSRITASKQIQINAFGIKAFASSIAKTAKWKHLSTILALNKGL